MNIRSHRDVLAETVDLAGLDVLDVGCGDGGLVRWLRDYGARPIGAECGDEVRARAVAADRTHADSYVDAPGEELPFGDTSFDLVVFSYSLHHVPIASMGDAMSEARRVLRPGGTLYVLEPQHRGPDTYAAFPAVDERAVQAAAQETLSGLDSFGFALRARTEYTSESRYDDVDSWLDLLVGDYDDRRAAVAEHEQRLRRQFHELGDERDDGWAFAAENVLAVFTAV